MMVPIFISGVILGGLLGILLGPHVSQWWQRSWTSKRDIDRLIEQFQALFRQLDQGKRL
jgi:preprotein translocase subunit Sec63